jgi:bacillithiol biosynthesis cysteine-adding enzyme BshC
MASEDHDFEEINHFKTYSNNYETKAKTGGAVGKIQIEDDVFISEFEHEFKNSAFGKELILLMKKVYKKGNSFSEATRIIVQELFADYGLIIIDGDDIALKNKMKNIFKDELLHQSLYKSIKDTVHFISENYEKVQVNPREINLFYLSETRNRIEKSGNLFKVLDTEIQFSESEILEELENHPEKFSPNALMRPIYQETILPNLAYIGGNAEIMYWFELENYFKKLNLSVPVLIPRNSLVFISEKTLLKTEKLGLTIHDFYKNFESVTKEILLKNNEIITLLNQEEDALKNQFQNISDKAKLTDKSFENLVNAEKKRQLKSFERMKKRLFRAEKIKQQEKLERLENLFLMVHPDKNWQERIYNFSVFYADFGTEWIHHCYNNLNVENSELIIVSI